MPRVGDVLGRYRLEALLGEGGMGQVFRAFDDVLKRRVALKVLLADVALGSEGKARLLREAQAAATLEHPNAVHVYDVGEHDEVAFIAMELVDGMTLRAMLGKRPRRDEVLRWLGEVAEALAAAHDLGLVHRDVKPDNVMIRTDGRAKVLDFGIARRAEGARDGTASTGSNDHLATLTEKGARIGTVAYMPPEQLVGEAVDGRADQFAWGVMAYEALSGELPWGPPKDAVSLGIAIATKAPKPLFEASRDVPSNVAAVVHRAIMADRTDRFPSMRDVVTALGGQRGEALTPDVVANAGSIATAPTEIAVVSKAARAPLTRSWTRRVLVIGALLVVALGGVAALVAARHRAGSAVVAPSAIAAPAPLPTAISALPPSSACSVQAAAAYRAGLQAVREASYEGAQRDFNRAVELDDGCASAHLQMVWVGLTMDSRSTQREHLRKATSLRATLTERDRATLPALETISMGESPDWEAFHATVEEVRRRFPGDAALCQMASAASESLRQWETQREEARAAVALDSDYADAWEMLARAELELGHEAAGLDALDQCLRIAPGSLDCTNDRIRILRSQGRCDAVVETARRALGFNPGSSELRHVLASALLDAGGTLGVASEILRQRWALLPPSERDFGTLEDQARLYVYSGNFAASSAASRALARLAEGDTSLESHLIPAQLDLELALEAGDERGAAAIADTFLGRRLAWTTGGRGQVSRHWDALYEPTFISAQRRGGRIDAVTERARLEEWGQSLPAGGLQVTSPVARWAFVDGLVAIDDAEVRSAADRYNPAWLSRPDTTGWNTGRVVGTVLVRGGRAAEALPWLRASAEGCATLATPFSAIRARRWLGEALERTGDKPGACAAYSAVIARWGKAKPRSVTAEEAAGRAKALGCEGLPR